MPETDDLDAAQADVPDAAEATAPVAVLKRNPADDSAKKAAPRRPVMPHSPRSASTTQLKKVAGEIGNALKMLKDTSQQSAKKVSAAVDDSPDLFAAADTVPEPAQERPAPLKLTRSAPVVEEPPVGVDTAAAAPALKLKLQAAPVEPSVTEAAEVAVVEDTPVDEPVLEAVEPAPAVDPVIEDPAAEAEESIPIEPAADEVVALEETIEDVAPEEPPAKLKLVAVAAVPQPDAAPPKPTVEPFPASVSKDPETKTITLTPPDVAVAPELKLTAEPVTPAEPSLAPRPSLEPVAFIPDPSEELSRRRLKWAGTAAIALTTCMLVAYTVVTGSENFGAGAAAVPQPVAAEVSAEVLHNFVVPETLPQSELQVP